MRICVVQYFTTFVERLFRAIFGILAGLLALLGSVGGLAADNW
jgi:hypothetical protein